MKEWLNKKRLSIPFLVCLRNDTVKTKNDLFMVKIVINAKKIRRKAEAEIRPDEQKYFGKFNPSAMGKYCNVLNDN